jgi:hypothetical protein
MHRDVDGPAMGDVARAAAGVTTFCTCCTALCVVAVNDGEDVADRSRYSNFV